MDPTTAGITSDLNILTEHSGTFAKGCSINLLGHWIGAEWDTKIPVVKVFCDPTGSKKDFSKTSLNIP